MPRRVLTFLSSLSTLKIHGWQTIYPAPTHNDKLSGRGKLATPGKTGLQQRQQRKKARSKSVERRENHRGWLGTCSVDAVTEAGSRSVACWRNIGRRDGTATREWQEPSLTMRRESIGKESTERANTPHGMLLTAVERRVTSSMLFP